VSLLIVFGIAGGVLHVLQCDSFTLIWNTTLNNPTHLSIFSAIVMLKRRNLTVTNCLFIRSMLTFIFVS